MYEHDACRVDEVSCKIAYTIRRKIGDMELLQRKMKDGRAVGHVQEENKALACDIKVIVIQNAKSRCFYGPMGAMISTMLFYFNLKNKNEII